MLLHATVAEAEAAMGRAMTWAEAAWFRYATAMPDYCLYFHVLVIILAVHTLAPLPLVLLEHLAPSVCMPYKLQPRVRLSPAAVLRCYVDVVCVVLLTIGSLQIISYPKVKMSAGFRMGLPLPSLGETAAQLVVYMLVEDYVGYWIHRLLHTRWGFDKIHRVHHEFKAPMGFAAAYGHWADEIILGIPSFVGPAIVPCHITTLWLWFLIRHLQAVDTHTGFDFPLSPTKVIPFYGGAEYHDYHHKGYIHHKASLAKVKEKAENNGENGGRDMFNSGKQGVDMVVTSVVL